MTKEQWFAHLTETIGTEPKGMKDRFKAHLPCKICSLRWATKRKNDAAKHKRQVYADLGMKRVVGALGGVYYE
jgi:hypothetical protein